MSARALEVFSGHLRCLEDGRKSDFEALCGEHGELAEELRQLLGEWERMSEVMERLGPKQGPLSLQLRERYGDSVDPEISLSQEEEKEGGVLDESSAALMSKLSSQGGSERYKAQDEIARGGMGAILKVWDEDLRRPLAMKVALREDGGTTGAATDMTSQKRLSRFLEEAQITSQLDHPGIVPVHDLGIDAEGRVYFTMQLVDGRDMREIVSLAHKGEEGWDLRRLVGVMIRVCEALAYAHAKGVVHRDIKPGNVMVGKFGEVFVMDWGLAKVMGREEVIDEPTSTIIHTLRSDGSSAEHTLAGDVVGTPAFMAPEQALGRGDEVGPASDLYAVGAMLYLMLTGQIPYQPLGESVSALQILEAVKAGPPWPISNVNSDAPPELVAVCEKAMAREIPERFSDAMALGEELRNWLEGHAVTTYETGVFYGLRKWVGRNKGMAATLLGMVVVVIGGLGVFFQQQQRSIENLRDEQQLTLAAQRTAEENEEDAQTEAARANEEAQRANEEARLHFEAQTLVKAGVQAREALAEKNRRARYRAQIMAAWFSLRLFEADRTRQHLDGADRDLRGWEWGYLGLGSDDRVRDPIAHANGSLDLFAVGDEIVSMGSDAVVRIFDAADWSHDDLPVRYGIPTIGAQLAQGRNVCALSVDGVLATAVQSSVILLWELKSLDVIGPLTGGRQVSGSAGVVMDLVFSADGRFLASVDSVGRVRVWDVGTREILWEVEIRGVLSCVAFHPVLPQLAIGADDGRVDVWAYDADGGERVGGFVEEHGSAIHALEYSHDGQLLASAVEDGEVQLWDQASLGVEEISVDLILDDIPEVSRFPSLTDRLQSTFKQALEYLQYADPKLRLRGHQQGAPCLAFRWDDQVVYAGGGDGTVRAWSAVDGGVMGVWEGHEGQVTGLEILRGGRVLSGADDGSLRVFDPYWEATRQAIGGGGGGPVLFVCEDAGGAGALAVSMEGSIHRERPEDALGAARVLATSSGSWTAGTQGGEFFALVAGDELVWILDPENGEVLRTPVGHDAGVVDIASDEMGYRVITGSSDSRAIVWEAVDSLAVVESWSISHERGVVAVAISADGRVVATADKTKALRLCDAEKQETLQIWSSAHRGQINALALAADGEWLASASREEVRVFLLGEKEAVQVLGPHRAIVRAILFHEDGERLVSGDENGDIYLWDVDGAEVLIELTAHEAAITSLAFVDGGRTLLSGDASGVVLAWRSERLPERYQRWEQSERRQLREQGIMRYFEGDHELAHERLSEGVAGLHADDPAVESLLNILTPSAEQVEPASGE